MNKDYRTSKFNEWTMFAYVAHNEIGILQTSEGNLCIRVFSTGGRKN